MKAEDFNLIFIVIAIFLAILIVFDIKSITNKPENFKNCSKLNNIIKEIDKKANHAIHHLKKNKRIREARKEANKLIKELKKYKKLKETPVSEKNDDYDYNVYYNSCIKECKSQYDKYQPIDIDIDNENLDSEYLDK